MEEAVDSAATDPAVRLEGFTFAYPQHEPLWEPLSWEVERGAFCLLVGATGCGKTTLLRCLKPELAPVGEKTGKATVLGCAVEDYAAADSACDIGFVLQSPENQIVCDDVLSELAFGLENIAMEDDLMHRRLAEVAHFFGIESWLHDSCDQLSGGQKQLVNLAAILALRPRLLLLDEPTAQLDPVAEQNFLHALFRINRELGITVVVATHAPEPMYAYASGMYELDAAGIHERDLEAARRAYEDFLDEVDEGAACAGEQVDEAAAGEVAVGLQDAYFRYTRDGHWVLRGCDLAVPAGSIHALVGGNGCGKTTLLRVICGTLKLQRGSVANELRGSQAYVPQDPRALFVCDSVSEELAEWADDFGYGKAEEDEALARFGLGELRELHPYDLSGGQQQRLALAKVLLASPRLLLLDEPTKGLDTSAKVEVARILRDQAADGVTCIIASHDLSFVRGVADSVSLLFDGEAVCSEDAKTFFAGNLFYRPHNDGFARVWDPED